MESNWRMNVYKLIGSTYAAWDIPIGHSFTLCYLCAELDPHLLYLGKVWTHLLKLNTPGSAQNAAFARIQGTGNVLNEIQWFYSPLHFPFNFSVLPD